MRVVIGIDGSDRSRLALELVAGLALPTTSRLHLVAAYELPSDWTGLSAIGTADAGAEEETRGALFDTLDGIAEPLRRRGLAVHVSVERGRPGSVLLGAAEELLPDLLVVGNRGHGAAASVLLGSVSAELVDHAPCPVLVARSADVRHVLFATDGSDSARVVPAILARWGIFRDLPADVLSVAPPRSGLVDSLVTPWAASGDRSVPEDDAIERHRRIADEAAAELIAAAHWRTCASVRVGDPAHEIEDAARNWEADLIVTGSHGRTGFERLMLGSVAHHVLLHSHASVLVMRGHVPARSPRPARAASLTGALVV